MKTPVDRHDFSNKPFPKKIRSFDYDAKCKILKVAKSRGVRWKSYYWIYVSMALRGKHMVIEDVGNGIWKGFFRNAFLGFFNEKCLRNKQESTRLEIILV